MSDYRFETLQLHVGQEEADPATDSRAVPIYQTTSYVFKNSAHAAARFGLADAGNIYGRLTNSTQEVLEKRLAALEGGVAALAVASGAAAITYAILALAPDGGHVVSQKTIYGGSYNLMEHTLPHYGVTATFVDAHDLAEVENAIQDNTRAIYLETLGNPNSDIPDIDAIAAIAHRHGLPLVIDNTFGTPYLIRPIEHGADIVVHSATKFIGGHGTTLGGIIVDSGKFDWKASGKYPAIADANPSYHGVSFVEAAGPAAFATYVRAILLRDTGAAISPFNAFLLLQGVETLSLRLERHAENTKKVVDYLASHPLVERVNHPSLPNHPDHALYEKYFPNGGASIFTFDIKGSQQEAYAFIDHLKIFSLLANVADVKSLVIHPATTTHSQLTAEELKDQGIHPGTIRLSIGTEHIDDILADLELGFAAVRNLP
ncbi:MAG: O-acetylhomoserine aminocarboxypropyltransferase/cysteine synthase [Lachnospiraceae bacterium]|nr:O-acetylhomoserine aminocarboxypropyltransferase/cysteine synthase [Lachnospiraceae bacterium]